LTASAATDSTGGRSGTSVGFRRSPSASRSWNCMAEREARATMGKSWENDKAVIRRKTSGEIGACAKCTEAPLYLRKACREKRLGCIHGGKKATVRGGWGGY